MNVREEEEEIRGELQGVLPKARAFEFKVAESSQVLRGKIAPTITDHDDHPFFLARGAYLIA